MMRANPEELIRRNENLVEDTGGIVYYDKTMLMIGIIALAAVAMVCITAMVISRR